MDAVVNIDSDNLLQYVESVSGRINVKGPEEKEMVTRYLAIIREGTKMYDGQMAMSYGLAEEGNPLGFVQVGTTQASPSELKQMLSETVVLGKDMLSGMEALSLIHI